MGECTFVTDVLYYPIEVPRFIQMSGSDWAQRDRSRADTVSALLVHDKDERSQNESVIWEKDGGR